MSMRDTCSKCGAPINTPECVFCTKPPLFPPMPTAVYINHCWNCKANIDSRVCRKSETPGMGYHCPVCGKDLTEFKTH